MNFLEFGLTLIRSPWLARITDRTFLTTLGAALTTIGGLVAIWRTDGVPVNDKINATMAAWAAITAVVAAWNHSEKAKDTAIAVSAMNAHATTVAAASQAPLQFAGLAYGDPVTDPVPAPATPNPTQGQTAPASTKNQPSEAQK